MITYKRFTEEDRVLLDKIMKENEGADSALEHFVKDWIQYTADSFIAKIKKES